MIKHDIHKKQKQSHDLDKSRTRLDKQAKLSKIYGPEKRHTIQVNKNVNRDCGAEMFIHQQ